VLGDVLGHPANDLGVDLEQVHPAHAGLARQARGDDDDVGAGDRLVPLAVGAGGGADHLRLEALDGSGLVEIQGEAFRLPLMMSVSTTVSKTSYSASRCAVVEP
jgi:hypothetical protein